MRFKDSFLYTIIEHVVTHYKNTCMYFFILSLPCLLMFIAIGLVGVAIIDTITATKSVFRNHP